MVGHVGFADPFDAKIGKVLETCGVSHSGLIFLPRSLLIVVMPWQVMV